MQMHTEPPPSLFETHLACKRTAHRLLHSAAEPFVFPFYSFWEPIILQTIWSTVNTVTCCSALRHRVFVHLGLKLISAPFDQPEHTCRPSEDRSPQLNSHILSCCLCTFFVTEATAVQNRSALQHSGTQKPQQAFFY